MDSKKINILYIDDEMANLIGFKASYREKYNIQLASSSIEALEILEKHPELQVIISDQRMPDKTGVELFETIRKNYPLPSRILCTAYTDIDTVIDAVNRGNIYRYIKKPFEEADIISAIEESYKLYIADSLLRVKNEQLKVAYKELDKFAYSVTHDLSGPASSIAGAIELLEEEDNIDNMREMLYLIKNSVQKLNEFILSIQEYYRINRGELVVEKIDFNLLVDDLKSIYKVSETIDKIELITHVNQPNPFFSDIMSIRLVLNNLLSNAFKYQRKDNPHKKVELSIHGTKTSTTITVKDNGIGIKDEYHDAVFQMFFRATSEATGSGFGLYNIKDVLKKLNGTITLKSKYGEGTEFTVTIASQNIR